MDYQESIFFYNSFDDAIWLKHYFDTSGGWVVVHRQRIEHSLVSKNEQAKYDKELAMAMVFAKNGYKIEMLEEVTGISSPDVRINGEYGDFKRLSSHNNIIRHAKNAVNKQSAKIVLFQFDNETKEIYHELHRLRQLNIRCLYFFTNKNVVHTL